MDAPLTQLWAKPHNGHMGHCRIERTQDNSFRPMVFSTSTRESHCGASTSQTARRPSGTGTCTRTATSHPSVAKKTSATCQRSAKTSSATRNRKQQGSRVVVWISSFMIAVSIGVGAVITLSFAGFPQAVQALPLLGDGPSSSQIPVPANSIPPSPNFNTVCAASGADSTAPCLAVTLMAINNARHSEKVPNMVLPAGFANLSVPDQLLVAINSERTARGLQPFASLVSSLNAASQKGALSDSDPGSPGKKFSSWNGEWAGNVSNGLEADYLFMYDDGTNGPNTDCPGPGAPGCWAHREGILEYFGRNGRLEMGAAFIISGRPGANGNPVDSKGFNDSLAMTMGLDSEAPSKA